MVDATVTAVRPDGIWVQQGTGPYSGLHVTCPSDATKFAGVSVGDVVTIRGEYGENSALAQTQLYVCDTFGEVTVTNPGGGTVQVTNVSEDIAAEKWESVLVRVQGPLTVESVVENDPNFGSYFSVSGASWGSFAGRPWLYDTTSLPGFAQGATMTSVVGIVDSLYGDSRQDLMPRSAADFEGYTPAP